ncbi:hypothetical protein J6590_086950, partial [Homalodisca vitripennis]
PRPESFLQHLQEPQSPLSLPQTPPSHSRPRRPPQPSGRGCDVRDLRTNPGDSGDLSK